MDYLVIALLLVLFPLPWVLVFRHLLHAVVLQNGSLIDRICYGYGAAFCCLYLASFLGFTAFLALYGVVALLALITWRRSRAKTAPVGSETRALLVLLAVYLALRSIPAIHGEYPLGWDPYFHLVLADKISLARQVITDWRPYENIELNYPVGSHLMMGLFSWIGRLPVHKVFNLGTLWFTALTGAQVFSFASRATGNRELALYAALAYLFTADMGSFDYFRWGGLPNLIGMYLFLGILTMLAQEGFPSKPFHVLFTILFSAVSLVHHHCMVTGGLVLLWLLAASAWRGKDPKQARRLLFGLLASAVVGAPYYLGFLSKVSRLKATGIGAFTERIMGPVELAQSLGVFFFFAVAIGAWKYYRHEARPRMSPVLTQALAALLVIFAFMGYVARVFTPSRFITDAVMLLSLFAGYLFWRLRSEGKLTQRQAMGCILAGFATIAHRYQGNFRIDVPPGHVQAYDWVRAHARPGAWVIDGRLHGAYFTRHAASDMPIPTSEFTALAVNKKAMQQLKGGAVPPEAIGREVLFVLPESAPTPARTRLLWRLPGDVKVLELEQSGPISSP